MTLGLHALQVLELILKNSCLPVTEATLAAFSDAWNLRDVDALMSFMADGCVFETTAGPDGFGTRYVATESVRKARPKLPANPYAKD